MSDALILGAFSVTSPRCLQDQSWNAQRHRVKRSVLTCTLRMGLFIFLATVTDRCLAFLLEEHPRF